MQQQDFKEQAKQIILEKYFKNAKSLQDDYVSSKLIASDSGYRAASLIPKDEVVYALSGRIVPEQYLHQFHPQSQKRKIQIRDGVFALPLFKTQKRDLLKHSSAPNCGIQDQVFIVAMKDIHQGELLTFDLAMVGGPYQENKEEQSSLNDTKISDAQVTFKKYGKYCSDFIKHRAMGKSTKDFDSVVPYNTIEISPQEYAILDQIMYNPEIQAQDFISVRCQIQENKEMEGFQVRSLEKIPKGRHVSTWGGRVFKDLENQEDVNHTIQIHEYLNQGPMIRALSQADGINHSCNPNLGISGTLSLVAMRDIEVGQLLTFDYCMTDSDDIDNFDCLCKSTNCRGKVGVQEWRNKEIQERYKGYFSNYIQRRIDQL